MNKNIYEILAEVSLAKTKEEKSEALLRNRNTTLLRVLQLAYHPNFQWLVNLKPKMYKPAEVPAGLSYAKIDTELRKLYLFQKGHPTAEALTKDKQQKLLTELLESLEPREADVIIGIFNKKLNADGLTYELVRDTFPGCLP